VKATSKIDLIQVSVHTGCGSFVRQKGENAMCFDNWFKILTVLGSICSFLWGASGNPLYIGQMFKSASLLGVISHE